MFNELVQFCSMHIWDKLRYTKSWLYSLDLSESNVVLDAAVYDEMEVCEKRRDVAAAHLHSGEFVFASRDGQPA